MYNAAVNSFTGIVKTTKRENYFVRSAKDLSEAEINKEYIIQEIVSDDEEMTNFLFTLGCFKGESVTVISVLAENYVISVKDARYSIDDDLAKAILI